MVYSKTSAEFRTIIKAQGPDPLPDKVSKLRLFIGRNIDIMKGTTVRVKEDGTVAADDDSDAETVHIDEDGNLLNIPLSLQDGEDSDLREWNTDASMTRLSTPMDLTSEDDTAEAVGVRKVLKEFRRHPKEMGQHLKRVMETANELQTEDQKRASLRANSARAVDERETTINYMNHYRLVEKTKLEPMARAFVVEDRERACVLTLQLQAP
ncbi:uncharacterized protein [Diadema antillarum]|uniref:uncharacterized protein n=1 Tax=Diadema antillarum TaxID=105358 RepID=UPI003A852E6F